MKSFIIIIVLFTAMFFVFNLFGIDLFDTKLKETQRELSRTQQELSQTQRKLYQTTEEIHKLLAICVSLDKKEKIVKYEIHAGAIVVYSDQSAYICDNKR